MNSPPPIPIPWRQRWHDVRLRLLPVVVFVAAVAALVFLWQRSRLAPVLVGQAEPVQVNAASPKPGVVVGLSVHRFQRVKAGDPIGEVMVADPKVLESSLGVIRAEIELLRVSLNPIVQQQRNVVDYGQLRLDWMKERAALATARVNLQLAEIEWRRNEDLFRDKIVSASLRDQARAAYDGFQRQVEELARLVAEVEKSFTAMQPGDARNLSHVSDEPMRAAIAVQEGRLRLAEAELTPVVLRSPMDGVVTTVFHRSGEAVPAAQPVVAIASVDPVHIVGYLRLPPDQDLQAGMRVQVRSRGARRETGEARVLAVGTQFEMIPDALAVMKKFTGVELGLPVEISLPANLHIRPGELVDIHLLRGQP